MIGASAATPTAPRFGTSWMICGGLAKHPDSEAHDQPGRSPERGPARAGGETAARERR